MFGGNGVPSGRTVPCGKTIPGGVVVLQFHLKVLVANCWELKALRARLDRLQPVAA